MRTMAHPALPQPLRVWSPNRSNRHRNHTISAAIQMKNQKDQRRTSPKSVVIESIAYLFCGAGRGARERRSVPENGLRPAHPPTTVGRFFSPVEPVRRTETIEATPGDRPPRPSGATGRQRLEQHVRIVASGGAGAPLVHEEGEVGAVGTLQH